MHQRFRIWTVIALIGLGHSPVFAQDGEGNLATPTPGKHQLKASPMQVLQHLIVQQNQQIIEQKEQITALAKALEAQNEKLEKIVAKLDANETQVEMLHGQTLQMVDHLEDLKKSTNATASLPTGGATPAPGSDSLDEPESVTQARLANPIPQGDPLAIPQGASDGSAPATTGGLKVHVVQRGETVSAIADQHGVSVGDLLRANKITNPRRLQIGQTLTIP